MLRSTSPSAANIDSVRPSKTLILKQTKQYRPTFVVVLTRLHLRGAVVHRAVVTPLQRRTRLVERYIRHREIE